MANHSFEELQKLDLNITKRLFSFIKREIDIELLHENLDINIYSLNDENNKILFNTWLSMDYIDNTGKNFVEKFIEKYNRSLKSIEKDILNAKNKSFVSILEIINYKDEHMNVRDVLQNKYYHIWEPNLSNVLDEGEFIFARVGKLLDNYIFIGDLNYLPFSAKSNFIEYFLIDYNRNRKLNPYLSITDYLKKHSMELIKIYNDCILDILEYEEDITSILYDEIYEFESYLQVKTHGLTIKKYISNLIEFFEYYLSNSDYTLYDLDKIDFNVFFKKAIKDEFIISQEELNSYLSTFIKYLSFIKNKSSSYKTVYQELLDISNNRFYYMDKLKSNSTPYNLDRNFVEEIAYDINDIAMSLILDFDKFIIYAIDKKIELTDKKKHIKRTYLFELNEIFEEPKIIKKAAMNQEDFPIINLLYKIAIKFNLAKIEKDYLVLTKKGTNFIRLKDEEKFVIFFNYIWSKEFINEITNINIKSIEIIKRLLIDMVNSISIDNTCSMVTIISTFEDYPDFFTNYSSYLKYLGLIKINFYPEYNFEITALGKAIFKFLKQNNERKENSIISLDNYRSRIK